MPELSSPQLVGRDIERQRLVGALEAAEESCPTLTLIIGEAGVGKTRLAREAQRQAAERGMLVLRGECVELSGGEFPYAPIAAALRDVAPTALEEALTNLPVRARLELARVFPDVIGDPEGPGLNGDQFAQTRVFAWLLSLLRQLSEQVPLLLAFEDLQLADASSRDFLHFLALNMRSERIGVIATVRGDELHRDHPVRRLVAELIRSDHVYRIDLQPLRFEDVERQVAEILETDPPPDLVARLFARSEGNPFYTEELLAAHRAITDRLPSALRDALLLRVESRSDAARAIAQLVSVVSRPAGHALLEAAAGLPWPELKSALRECVDHQLLVCDRETDEYRFRHALLREAVYDDLLPSERCALHRRIASTLENAKGEVSAAECAYHWDAAGEPERALRWLIEAGTAEERVFAHTEALAHFSRALDLWPAAESVDDLGIDLVGLLARTAEAARWTGNVARAKDLCEQALRGFDHDSDPARAAALYERLGRYQPWNVEGSLAAYDCALKLLPDENVAERIRLQVNQAYALTFLGRWREAKERAETVFCDAAGEGLVAEQASAGAVLGVALAFLGDLPGGERHLRHALELAEQAGDLEDVAQIQLDLGEVLRLQGRIESALEVMLEGERITARDRTHLYGNFMAVNAADDLFRLGRWHEVEVRLKELGRRQLGPTAELLMATVGGRLETARGQFKSAKERLERAVELTHEAALLEFIPTVHAAYAELELWQNAPERARAQVAAGLDSIGQGADALHLPALYSMGARVEADHAEEARSRGGKIEAEQARQEAAAHSERLSALLDSTESAIQPPEAEAHLASCRAELTRAEGRSSPERWARAVELWKGLNRPYPTAYAEYRHAEALVGSASDRSQAQQVLTEAGRLAADLSAEPLHTRIQALARAARLPLSAEDDLADADSEPVAEKNAFDLTAREIQVLALMAAGFTNREIAERLYISQKTAGVHVSHILSKLGVANRVMAAAAAQRLGIAPPN